jgi:hypothetical protein
MKEQRRLGQHITTWDNVELIDRPDAGPVMAVFPLGVEPDSAVFSVVRFAPGAQIPVHRHECDYCSVVVKGWLDVGRHREDVGSIRIVTAGTAYGPLVAGPEGCTVLDIFSEGRGVVPQPVRDEDRQMFEGPGVSAYVAKILERLPAS